MRAEAGIEPIKFRGEVYGCGQRPLIDRWERGGPVRTEREARKTLILFETGMTFMRLGCTRVPGIYRPLASWIYLWAG